MIESLGRARRVCQVVGLSGLALCALWGWFFARQQFFVSYLIAWLFFLGIALGSMVNLMVYRLTGGAWGELLLRPLEGAMRALPLVAALGLPLLLGLDSIYPWASPDAAQASGLVKHSTWYLNVPFFLGRVVVYFVLWLYLAYRMRALDGPAEASTPRRVSIAGLMIYALTITLAAIDWIMSLTPGWYSTTFGLLIGVGQTLSAFAAAMLAAGLLVRRGVLTELGPPRVLQDIGNLMLMFVLLWTYLAFTQYLIVWAEDLPSEISWYLPRVHTSWHAVGPILMIFHFALPFLILLSRRAKRSAMIIAGLGGMMLLAHWVDVLWLVAPTFRAAGFQLEWGDLLATLGIGGLAVATVLRHLSLRTLHIASAPPLRSSPQHG